jgi:hypothetical protein
MKTRKFWLIVRLILPAVLLPVTASFMETGGNMYAQGLFNNHPSREKTGEGNGSNNNDEGNGGGNASGLRAGGTENPDDAGQANKLSPVKEGWGVLLAAGVGYGLFITNRKKRKKNASLRCQRYIFLVYIQILF